MMRTILGLALGLSLAFASTAGALTLNPGDNITTTINSIIPPASPNIIATHSTPVTLTQGATTLLAATLTDNVVRESNGDLTFQYVLIPTSVDFTSFGLAAKDFASFTTDVEVFILPPAVSPVHANFQRSSDGIGVALSITTLNPVTNPNHTTGGFEIMTNATTFDSSGSISLAAALSQPVSAAATSDAAQPGQINLSGQFEPTAATVPNAVPLPSPIWLVVAGLPLIHLARRRIAPR